MTPTPTKERDRTISMVAEEEIVSNLKEHLKGITSKTPIEKQEVCCILFTDFKHRVKRLLASVIKMYNIFQLWINWSIILQQFLILIYLINKNIRLKYNIFMSFILYSLKTNFQNTVSITRYNVSRPWSNMAEHNTSTLTKTTLYTARPHEYTIHIALYVLETVRRRVRGGVRGGVRGSRGTITASSTSLIWGCAKDRFIGCYKVWCWVKEISFTLVFCFIVKLSAALNKC